MIYSFHGIFFHIVQSFSLGSALFIAYWRHLSIVMLFGSSKRCCRLLVVVVCHIETCWTWRYVIYRIQKETTYIFTLLSSCSCPHLHCPFRYVICVILIRLANWQQLSLIFNGQSISFYFLCLNSCGTIKVNLMPAEKRQSKSKNFFFFENFRCWKYGSWTCIHHYEFLCSFSYVYILYVHCIKTTTIKVNI